MGGSGGSFSYSPSKLDQLHRVIEAKQKAEQERLDGDVNELLQNMLASMNERDTEAINDYLDHLKETLGNVIEIDKFLLGGSVAKHTYVDGLSDVDALVVLDYPKGENISPDTILNKFHRLLNDRLPRDQVESIEKGKLAVTVKFRDGHEIQLLPALREGKRQLQVSDSSGKDWRAINPQAFFSELTKVNQRMNGALVPTIKIAKSINDNLPEQKQLSGYHIESLALESVKQYNGPSTVKALVMNFFKDAQSRVLAPIKDQTGQSRTVDAYLGSAGNIQRRIAADALAAIERKLRSATTAEEWGRIIES
jgi:hypothetical protein